MYDGIWMLVVVTHVYYGVAVTSIPFDSRERCEAAATQIRNLALSTIANEGADPKTLCVPTGVSIAGQRP